MGERCCVYEGSVAIYQQICCQEEPTMIVQKCNLGQRNIQEVRVLPLSSDPRYGFRGEWHVRWYLTQKLPRLGGKFEYETQGIRLKPFSHDTLVLFQWKGQAIAYGMLLKCCPRYYQFDPESICLITPITPAELSRIEQNFNGFYQSKLYLCNSKEELDQRRLRCLLALLRRKRSAYLGKRGTL